MNLAILSIRMQMIQPISFETTFTEMHQASHGLRWTHGSATVNLLNPSIKEGCRKSLSRKGW